MDLLGICRLYMCNPDKYGDQRSHEIIAEQCMRIIASDEIVLSDGERFKMDGTWAWEMREVEVFTKFVQWCKERYEKWQA